MNQKTTQQPISTPDNQILADFLHELNIARRHLTLYPTDHPLVTATSKKTLLRLDKLFANKTNITLGIAPDALFFEHQWLDKENPTFKAFATFLSTLGIASISFEQGLSAEQLIRFCQLLRSDRSAIDDFGGFAMMLEQQQIDKISLVPIDYNAFQASADHAGQHKAVSTDLWEDFLHGLLEDILELGDDGFHLDPRTIAELLNEKMAGGDASNLPTTAVNSFVAKFLDHPSAPTQLTPSAQLGEILNHLSPGLQSSFLNETFEALASNPAAADQFVKKLSPNLLQNALTPQLQQQLQGSPRLIELIGELVSNAEAGGSQTTKADSANQSKEMVRARLDVLFSEETHDIYLPDRYQATLKNISDNSTDDAFKLPEDEREELKQGFEQQSVELQFAAVIFQILEDTEALEDEEAVQQNLLDLSRFLLDTGNFTALHEIYEYWSAYLCSNKSRLDFFSEKVLTNHTQHTFMQEVLSGIDLWGEEQMDPIRNYIAVVGEPYTEAVIEQLGLAETFDRRQYWMQVLEEIGTDANQLLLKSLEDDRWYLIRNLLIVLGKKLKPATLKAVHRLTNHPHPKVRQEVIRVLLSCNPATAKRMLLEGLRNEDPEELLAAIEVAQYSHDSDILSSLHRQLQTNLNSDSNLDLKNKTLASLAVIGSRHSLSLLRHLLQKQGIMPSRRQKLFQHEIIQSIAKYPQKEGEKLLRELASGRQRQQAKLATELLQQGLGEKS